MKTIEYHTVDDKPEWGNGPWISEPDKVQYVEQGFPALIVRNHHGSLCGYVGVPKTHPAFEKDYNDVDDEIAEVHGGLTYSRFCQEDDSEEEGICHVVEPGEDDHIWWLGFDCGHAWDLAPAMSHRMRQLHPEYREIEFEQSYRDIDFVRREIAVLAEQLRAMA